ncbi:MAG: hypothetical protein OXC72_07675, partial [Roseovarius sp.]|nr:hypothetical protein [Roseovarius sp.]
MSRSLIIGIYYAVLMLCIGLSSYFSYRGFFPTLGHMVVTLLFVAIIALGLFAAGTLIQIARDKKSVKEQVLALLMFGIFACFSTSSNFTHLYSEQRKETERENAIQQEEKSFNEQISKLKTAMDKEIKNHPDYNQDIRQYFDNAVQEYTNKVKTAVKDVDKFAEFEIDVNFLREEFKNLYEQANDPNHLGCGRLCKNHIKNIRDLVSVTELEIPSRVHRFNEFYVEFEETVWSQYCNSRGPLIRLFVFTNGEAPRNALCDNKTETVQSEAKPSETDNDDISTVNGIEAYLVELNRELHRISGLINDAALGNIGVDAPDIPESYGTASDQFNKSGPETLNGILIKYKNTGEWKSSENCSRQNIIQDPRNCLRKMSESLDNFKNAYDTEFRDSTETVDIVRINTERGQVGSIKDTLYSGFIERPHLPSTIFSFLVGIMIDVLPLIFCFVAFHGYDRPKKEPDDPFGG